MFAQNIGRQITFIELLSNIWESTSINMLHLQSEVLKVLNEQNPADLLYYLSSILWTTDVCKA